MDQFPSNSNKAKKPEVEVKQIVSEGVSMRKSPLGKRFRDTFLQGDGPKSTWKRVLFDVVLPGSRDLVYNTGLEMFQQVLYGATGRRISSGQASNLVSTFTQYSAMSKNASTLGRPDPRGVSFGTAQTANEFGELVMPSRVVAEEVLDNMYEHLQEYGTLTILQLCKMVGIPHNFTYDRYGWTDLQGSKVIRVGADYVLSLPRPIVVE